MIQQARMKDIEDIVDMGRTMFEASAYSAHLGDFDEMDAKTALARYIADRKQSLVLVNETQGLVDGFIVATTCFMPFSTRGYVSDVAFCSNGGRGVKLLREVMSWARKSGKACMFANGFGDPRTDKLYEAVGLKRVGGLYIGEGRMA